ncbi:MAG: ligase-associated DNA damage response DEXH box helicase [Akkermansiaceae bacterium]|nr:ligase-associated DNA damage response DEXH box helicase [Akkermansiaceae bacterium]
MAIKSEMLHPLLKRWLESKGWEAFHFQEENWKRYLEGSSGLLHAPTGFGKTLAVWLGPLSESLGALGISEGEIPSKAQLAALPCEVLWITPLRALSQDTLRALREPMDDLGIAWPIEARTGDTSSYRKAKLREKFPHTLVTTPESLSLMLTHPDTRKKLAHLKCVIVDEWHELLGTKRGIQTELCLARLRKWRGTALRTWALSATLGNLEEAAKPLHKHQKSVPKNFHILPADLEKKIEITTMIPDEIESFPWAGHLGTRLVGRVARQIREANTTLLFTNTRNQTENWFQQLSGLGIFADNEIALHHGSLDREERALVEAGLRDGTLRCVVCTSSLDLGVDFSPVDQVIQVGSPKGIARLTQRAGRAGHSPNQISRIFCVPTNALELVEFSAARDAWERREIEARRMLGKPLDVLVQHLVSLVLGQPAKPEDLRKEITSSHSYHDLTDAEWKWCIAFITNGGALSQYPQYKKAVLEGGLLSVPDKRTAQLHRLNIGTITSDAAITIKFTGGRILGSVEESFISKLKPGGQFVFAGRRLELVRFHKLNATVRMATKKTRGDVPSWSGGRLPLSSELARSVARQLHTPTDNAEMKAVAPILEIQKRWSSIPTAEKLLVEFTTSREGEHLFFFPFAGRLAHEGLASLTAYRISQRSGESIHTTQNDYGFSLTARRGLSLDEGVLREALSPENLEEDLLSCMNTAEMSRRQFRIIARVAGLLVPDLPGNRRPVRDLQVSARLLFEVFTRYDPDNLLLEQSRREILEGQLELARLEETLVSLAGKSFELVETERLTPMAFPLWADRLSAYLPAGDAATQLEKMLLRLQAETKK